MYIMYYSIIIQVSYYMSELCELCGVVCVVHVCVRVCVHVCTYIYVIPF